MRKFLYAFLLPIAFLYSCGNNSTVVDRDTVVPKPYDSFKAGVQKLQRNGFLEKFKGQNIDSLTEVYRKDSINGMKQLLIDAGMMLHVDIGLDTYPSIGDLHTPAPHEVYHRISDSIANRYPDLKATGLKHEYLPNFPGDKDTGWVMLSQKFGDTWYKRKLYYFEDWPVDNFIYRMYNTLLADKNENTRFYLVEFFFPDTGKVFADDFMHDLDVSRMGLMRLTKQQADTILSIPELDVEPEEEFNVFTTQQTEDMIVKFKSTGLVTPDLEKWYNDTICPDIRANSLYKQEDFLDFVDIFFARLMFDTLNVFNPYEEILMTMQNGSRGYFNPAGMNDDRVGKTNLRTVRFTLGGKVYEEELSSQNGIQSPFIFDMVNDALADQNAGGAFYSVLTREDVVLAMYLRDDEADKVMKSGFFTSVEKGAPSELHIIYGTHPAF